MDLITGTETSPNITQSETFTTANPDNPDEIVVAFNDSRGVNANPINISGASVSTDGGTHLHRVLPRPTVKAPSTIPWAIPLFCTTSRAGNGSPSGSSMAVRRLASAGTSPALLRTRIAGPIILAFTTAVGDDRESGWADNNPSSPFFGRMYVSWNDFNVGQRRSSLRFSSDNGATWHSPIMVSHTGTFIRNMQITGDMAGGGAVYIAGMDEGGGGFPHNDTNLIFKSTDGGNTWSNTYTGPPFPGPGVTSSGYFACMFTDNHGAYWRHEGWGEPAAFGNIVHLVYAQHGAGSDPGDVYYIRSTDGGSTFGTPFKLNTDATYSSSVAA